MPVVSVDKAKEQIAPIERKRTSRLRYMYGCRRRRRSLAGTDDRGAEHSGARSQQSAGDLARTADQPSGVGFVRKSDREGVGGLAGVGEGLAGAAALRDRIGRRRAIAGRCLQPSTERSRLQDRSLRWTAPFRSNPTAVDSACAKAPNARRGRRTKWRWRRPPLRARLERCPRRRPRQLRPPWPSPARRQALSNSAVAVASPPLPPR